MYANITLVTTPTYMGHCPHYCLVSLAEEPPVSCTRAPGMVGQSLRRRSCCAGQEHVTIVPCPSSCHVLPDGGRTGNLPCRVSCRLTALGASPAVPLLSLPMLPNPLAFPGAHPPAGSSAPLPGTPPAGRSLPPAVAGAAGSREDGGSCRADPWPWQSRQSPVSRPAPRGVSGGGGGSAAVAPGAARVPSAAAARLAGASGCLRSPEVSPGEEPTVPRAAARRLT